MTHHKAELAAVLLIFREGAVLLWDWNPIVFAFNSVTISVENVSFDTSSTVKQACRGLKVGSNFFLVQSFWVTGNHMLVGAQLM